jgi:hypothetical protein
MSQTFDPFDGCTPDTFAESWNWIRQHMRPADLDEHYHWGSEPERAVEFADLYFSHPELRGWYRYNCADLLVNAAVTWIDPEHNDSEPATEEQAVSLLGKLLQDEMTRHFLSCSTRPDMRELGLYPRLSRLIDSVNGGPLPFHGAKLD